MFTDFTLSVTIFAVALAFTLFVSRNRARPKPREPAPVNQSVPVEQVSASRALEINQKDPRVVSRSRFTDPRAGSTGDWSSYLRVV